MAHSTSPPIPSKQESAKSDGAAASSDPQDSTTTTTTSPTGAAALTSSTAPSTTTAQQQDLTRQSQHVPQYQKPQHAIPPSSTSPTGGRKSSLSTTDQIPPLAHPSRTQPLHTLLPQPNLLPAPSSNGTDSNNDDPNNNNNTISLNPITLFPFTASDLSSHGFEALLNECKNPQTGEVDKDVVKKLQEESIAQIKERIKERETREKEVERGVAEMEKIREMERKVWRRKMGVREDGGTPVRGAGAASGAASGAGLEVDDGGGGGGGGVSGTATGNVSASASAPTRVEP